MYSESFEISQAGGNFHMSSSWAERKENAITRGFEDPSYLPRNVFVHIIALLLSDTPIHVSQSSGKESVACTGSCALIACSLVSKRWLSIIHSPEALDVLWRRIRFEDCCLSRRIDEGKFRNAWIPRAEGLREIILELSPMFQTRPSIRALTKVLPEIFDKATGLRSLRLSGPFPYEDFFGRLDFRQFKQLKSLFMAGGHNVTWQPLDIIQACANLPSLRNLGIRFRNDSEDANLELCESIACLTQLQQLSLQWPSKSALPPTGGPPLDFSKLVNLTSLQFQRVPLQSTSAEWLECFTNLRALYWDPYVPVDQTGMVPAALSRLDSLQTLYIEVKTPFTLPSNLTGLRELTIVGRGCSSNVSSPEPSDCGDDNSDKYEKSGMEGHEWSWLESMTQLKSLRMQGLRLPSLPREVQELRGLTRLGLM